MMLVGSSYYTKTLLRQTETISDNYTQLLLFGKRVHDLRDYQNENKCYTKGHTRLKPSYNKNKTL